MSPDRREFLKTAGVVALASAGSRASAPTELNGQARPATQAPGAARRPPSPSGIGGLSPARLAKMHDMMAGHVASGRMPGLVTLVSRRGETHVDAIGTQTFGGTTRMRRDTIFRVASVTKPITAAAAMLLVEEGKLRLDDPVDALLPELANRRVLRAIDSALTDTVPAQRPISVRDLLTFRLGIGAVMVFPPRHPIQRAMEEAGIAPSANLPTMSPDEYMKRLGGLPLVYQPGERWLYNTGSEVLGVLIARASGRRFGDFLRERIFQPLDMTDTGFSVPATKVDRLPACYTTDFSTGKVMEWDAAGAGSKFARQPAFESGAGGLVSTVDDMFAFARMMLRKGRYGRDRILSRLSVEVMTSDQITPEQKAASPFFPNFWDSHGWGFGVSVITRRDDVSSVPGRYGWDGGYGTSWYVDPTEKLIGILMTQRVWDAPIAPAVQRDFWTGAYQAIDD